MPSDRSETLNAKEETAHRTIRVRVQSHPGGEPETFDMKVHAVPTSIEAVRATEASLDENELVLGVVVDGQAMAYPIRYLAMYEIVNDRIGMTPVAPSW